MVVKVGVCFLLLLLSFLLTQRTKMIVTRDVTPILSSFSVQVQFSVLPPSRFQIGSRFYMRSNYRSKRNKTEKQLKKTN